MIPSALLLWLMPSYIILMTMANISMNGVASILVRWEDMVEGLHNGFVVIILSPMEAMAMALP